MTGLYSEDFEQLDAEFYGRTPEETYAEFLSRIEKSKDEFIYYYGNYYNVMRELTGAAKDLLAWLTFHSEVNTGRVFMQSITQGSALKELGITLGTYYKALNQLKSKGIIKGSNAIYYINPTFAWKGTGDMRARFVRIYPTLS